MASATAATFASGKKGVDEQPLLLSLSLLDPLLQFLTKRSGKTSVPLSMLQAVLPGGPTQPRNQALLQHIPELVDLGILRLYPPSSSNGNKLDAGNGNNTGETPGRLSWDTALEIGFPSPPMHDNNWKDGTSKQQKKIIQQAGSLCGSTKTAAKRRLAALKRSLKARHISGQNGDLPSSSAFTSCATEESVAGEEIEDSKQYHSGTTDSKKRPRLQKAWDLEEQDDHPLSGREIDEELCHEARLARDSLQKMFRFEKPVSRGAKTGKLLSGSKTDIPQYILPKQAGYSGSHAAQTSTFGEFSKEIREKIPDMILDAFGIVLSPAAAGGRGKTNGRRLYSHQVKAISSAVQGRHTLVCTSTGSGKSLCFLIPALAAAYESRVSENCTSPTPRGISLIMFPTKALAQDQLKKLKTLVIENPELEQYISPATLDGDCPQEQRSHIAEHANIILTNPDTLHAAILPQWDKMYRRILEGLRYVVIDEAHIYNGMFGTHCALVLSRLQRLCMITRCDKDGPVSGPTFLSSSATLEHPQYHFRLLCPIPKSSEINVVTAKDDGSPRSAKHFFVWNPPLLSMAGLSTDSVFYPKQKTNAVKATSMKSGLGSKMGTSADSIVEKSFETYDLGETVVEQRAIHPTSRFEGLRRRHAADETALLLARAIINDVRCIAFCKTRSVVEWVYERTIAALRSQDSTKHLVEQVQPYRGGYKLSDRREIEKKLFEKKLLGVVATSALELGVDIGGIELTLHVGYPGSISSLLQQAGRGGRGGTGTPSLAVTVIFGSPAEQHLWKNPASLLSRGITSQRSFPINAGVVSGHLLCASNEFPLTGTVPATILRSSDSGDCDNNQPHLLSDVELFGSEEIYTEALTKLCSSGSVRKFQPSVASGGTIQAFKASAFIEKPAMRVSIRSVEPISFSIVDISHPLQGGLTNGIRDERAVLDNLPYSRVFYHAFPGAIILHRGQKYKVISMTRPPPYDPCSSYSRNLNLAAFAKPTSDKYMTRPLSTNTITIVKQIERVDIQSLTALENIEEEKSPTTIINTPAPDRADTEESFAGCGIITIKRTVHGYKKLSLLTRAELSRHELQLPEMEYDSFGLWIDCEAETLSPFLGAKYGEGIHALSHALLAVAPLFQPCIRSDLECDHAAYSPTRICLFDERAGGSGTTAELWKSLFMPNGLLEAAIDLLANCSSCCQEENDLGCPACIQSGQCLKFNQFLSRSSALIIGRRMLKRLMQSDPYKDIANSMEAVSVKVTETPRKKSRDKALRHAKDMTSAKERLFVVGRPSWPTDEDTMPGRRQEQGE